MLQTWRREEYGKAEQLIAALRQFGREDLALIVRPVKAADATPANATDRLTGNFRVNNSGSGQISSPSSVPKLPRIDSG